MTVATSDLYSVLRRLVDAWQACQTQLEANAIESVEAFRAATERDEDGHRCSPDLARLNAVESEVHARARWLAEARDFGCELLARDLDDWSDCEIIRRLSSWKDIDREPLVAALEELPGHRHAFVLEQLRKRFPEQVVEVEGQQVALQTHIGQQALCPSQKQKRSASKLATDGRRKIDIADDALKTVIGGLGKRKAMQMSAHLLLPEVIRKAGVKISKRTLERTPTYTALVIQGARTRERISARGTSGRDSQVLDQLMTEEDGERVSRKSSTASLRF